MSDRGSSPSASRLAERTRHGELRDFLAVAEDPEFCFAGEDFLTADQAGLTAAKRDTIVLDDALARELRADLLPTARVSTFFVHKSPPGWVAASDEIVTFKGCGLRDEG